MSNSLDLVSKKISKFTQLFLLSVPVWGLISSSTQAMLSNNDDAACSSAATPISQSVAGGGGGDDGATAGSLLMPEGGEDTINRNGVSTATQGRAGLSILPDGPMSVAINFLLPRDQAFL